MMISSAHPMCFVGIQAAITLKLRPGAATNFLERGFFCRLALLLPAAHNWLKLRQISCQATNLVVCCSRTAWIRLEYSHKDQISSV